MLRSSTGTGCRICAEHRPLATLPLQRNPVARMPSWIKRSCHLPSFIWGAGMTAMIDGALRGDWYHVVAGAVAYSLGWIVLRWQPTYP